MPDDWVNEEDKEQEAVLSDGSDHSEGVDSDETGDTSVNEVSTEEEDEDDDDDEEDEEEVAVEM